MDESFLKRIIKPGNNYNKYFGSSCGSTFLGNGNTDLSISIMAEWVEKYKHQVKELALAEFSNLPLYQTINKVYNFAHDHFQYKLDGNDQQIRSPYCSWLDRKNGIDCKSYSVLVSCILSNLGIVHFLRKTKQPGYAPESFSHVYVVIPEDQKSKSLKNGYFIIDATIHTNIELPFLQAKDKIMSKVGLPHYGLGFAAKQPLGCGCTDPANGLGYANFGNDEDVIFPAHGLGAGEVSNAVGQFAEGALTDYLSNIENQGWFNSTFGSVFSNGFNFSCWGASYNPTQAKDVAKMKMQGNATLLTTRPTQASFNAFLNNVIIEIGAANTSSMQKNLANCTREGYTLEKELLIDFMQKAFTALRSSGYRLDPLQTGVIASTPDQNINNWIQQNSWNFKYTTYKLTAPAVSTPVIIPTNPSTPGSDQGTVFPSPSYPGTGINPNGGNGNTGTDTGNGGYTPPKTQTAGVGKVLAGLTIAAIAGKLYMDSKKPKAKK
ncbi:hypothetical protein [Bizionia myxarmorum]|uniref:Uncharacterized protein n=1 Tax=Bizionia myxarmorum TaxID=291186 RepID=A0A5D0RBR3_9FLAO|nr:hypothetical protein [Bizionia myxarmorum]TYB78326.1 hypothetical protein ES674_00670 [Bizionia myxarmorum]